MKKIIGWVLGCLLLISISAIITVKKLPYFSYTPYAFGDLVLQHPKDDIDVVSFVWNNKKVKLKKIDGNWTLRKYYANNQFMDEFINNLSQASIIRTEKTTADGYKITLSHGANVLQNIQVFPYFEKDKSIVETDGKYFLVDRNLVPMDKEEEYYVQPLLSLDGHNIEQIIGFNGDIHNIRFLKAQKELPQKNYEYDNFVIITEDGIKIIGGIYQYEKSRWISLQLKTTIMPTKEADDFVKRYNFRYKNWYFLLAK